MTLCEVLTYYRKSNKVSFDTLVERTGIPKSTLQKIFTGVTVDPGFEVVRRIAIGLGVTVDMISAATHEAPALSPIALDVARRYDNLDAHGQHVVNVVLDAESERMSGQANDDEYKYTAPMRAYLDSRDQKEEKPG